MPKNPGPDKVQFNLIFDRVYRDQLKIQAIREEMSLSRLIHQTLERKYPPDVKKARAETRKAGATA